MKIFYQNYVTNKGIPSDTPQEGNLEQALQIFSGLNSNVENYFGIIDYAEKTIQFVMEAENKWLIEIPNPPGFINHQQFGSYEDCIEMIRTTFGQNKVIPFPYMRKVDIMNETLDELLNP